jgi:hypothetical protein
VPIIIALYGAGVALMTGYKITRESHARTLMQLAAQAEVEGAEPISATPA